MSMSLANLKLAVYSRLDPYGSTPAYTAVNEDNITRWANEKTSEVIKVLDKTQYQALIEHNSSLSFTLSGLDRIADVPTDYLLPVSLRAGSSSRLCHIFDDPNDYNRWDSSNFIFTPTANKPIAKIQDNTVFVRPTTITSGLLDYVKQHPTLSAGQDTVFSSIGDNVLIDLIVKEAMKILELVDE